MDNEKWWWNTCISLLKYGYFGIFDAFGKCISLSKYGYFGIFSVSMLNFMMGTVWQHQQTDPVDDHSLVDSTHRFWGMPCSMDNFWRLEDIQQELKKRKYRTTIILAWSNFAMLWMIESWWKDIFGLLPPKGFLSLLVQESQTPSSFGGTTGGTSFKYSCHIVDWRVNPTILNHGTSELELWNLQALKLWAPTKTTKRHHGKLMAKTTRTVDFFVTRYHFAFDKTQVFCFEFHWNLLTLIQMSSSHWMTPFNSCKFSCKRRGWSSFAVVWHLWR